MLAEQAAAMSALGAPRYSIFVLAQGKTAPIRAWLGVGDYALEADDVDVEGGIYKGIGLVGDIPGLSQLVGGLAERLDLVLNGASDDLLALADDEADEIRGALINIGVIFFDADWQAADPVAWLWDGVADVPTAEQDGSGAQAVRRVTLSVGSAFVDRTRPKLSFWTDSEQRRRSPDDSFCARVAGMSVDSTIQWPAPK